MSDFDRYFRLDAVHAELRARSVRSGFIAVATRAGQVVIGLASIIVLARLLTPNDFGVIAMVMPLTLLFGNIANLGLQSAVIHRESLDHDEASALFWLAARANALACLALVAAGPVLARIYDDPRVVGVNTAWACIVYIASLAAVHEALLKRQLRFGIVLGAQLTGVGLGAVAAIILASAGAGYWSLLVQVAVIELGRASAIWVSCRWRPSRPRPSAGVGGLRALRAYWADLAGFRVLTWLGDQPDRILVGAIGGATVVGLYDNARRWGWYPFVELFISLSDVAVSSLSRVRADATRYPALVRALLMPMLSACLPAITFLFVEAPLAVRVLLGDQWAGAVPFMRLMCIAAFAGALRQVTAWIFLSRGDTSRQLKWVAFVQAPVLLISVCVGAIWGALGVAAGVAVGCVLLAWPAVAYCVAGSPLSVRHFARAVWRPVITSIVAGTLLAMASPSIPLLGAPLIDLILRLALYLGLCAGIWIVMPGGSRALLEMFTVLTVLRGSRSVPASAAVPGAAGAAGVAASPD
jgi:PST family polysaccharide transporter